MFDSLDVATCVAKNGCCVSLGHSHQTLAVDLDDLVVDLNPETTSVKHQLDPSLHAIRFEPSVTLGCSSFRQRLDEDAELFQSGVRTDAHPNDAQPESLRPCTHMHDVTTQLRE